jgi:hypothetical protein
MNTEQLVRERDEQIAALNAEYDERIAAAAAEDSELVSKVGNLVHDTFCGTIMPSADLYGEHQTVAAYIIERLRANSYG